MITFTSLTGTFHIQTSAEVSAISEAPPEAKPANTLIFLEGNPSPFRVVEKIQKVLFILAHDKQNYWINPKGENDA